MEKATDRIERFYFPPPGQGMELQDRRDAGEVGIDPGVVAQIDAFVLAHPDGRYPSHIRTQRPA